MTQSTTEQSQSVIPREYKTFLKEIKERILSSQVKAAVAVNRELITLYWEIGTTVHQKQKSEGWGAKTIEKLLEGKYFSTFFP
ncbi:MAG: hypothetical protein K940chlam9_00833 [Chlamydiae bacterium]|nr:hypothetical protein [Chlamydiota bacterium]